MQLSHTEALWDIDRWDRLSLEECEEIAHVLAARLPASFRFERVATHEVGTQRHHVAYFVWRPSPQSPPSYFALLPGVTTITLGYDRSLHFRPQEALVREWQVGCLKLAEMVAIYGAFVSDILRADYKAFDAYLDQHLLPLRTVTCSPFLIELVAQEAGDLLPAPQGTYFRSNITQENQRSVYVKMPGHFTIPHRHVVAFVKYPHCSRRGFDALSSVGVFHASGAFTHGVILTVGCCVPH